MKWFSNRPNLLIYREATAFKLERCRKPNFFLSLCLFCPNQSYIFLEVKPSSIESISNSSLDGYWHLTKYSSRVFWACGFIVGSVCCFQSQFQCCFRRFWNHALICLCERPLLIAISCISSLEGGRSKLNDLFNKTFTSGGYSWEKM